MAKYERRFSGDFYSALSALHNGILNGSASAVRVYERYSLAGGNRVSLNLTLVGNGQDLFLSAITSGGSQAVFFKLNTIGEESFLADVSRIAQRL